MTQYREIQENLFEWFKDIPDKDVIDFISTFVYGEVNPRIEISKLIGRFLEENKLSLDYINYLWDIDNPDSSWRRTSIGTVDIINNIRHGLLSLAFNRYRNSQL